MSQKVHYAVIGLGHIAQVAVLPAFKNAKNSVLEVLVSSDPVKLKVLSSKYDVPRCFNYEAFARYLENCQNNCQIDAIYIALPNNMHRQYVELASRYGIHSLCEKPMAISSADCRSMIEAATENNTKLMIAYRLHFQRANLKAIKIAQSGLLGDLRIFNSTFSMQVLDETNIRLKQMMGGGTLYDIGIYCINAARYLFRSEPIEVMAKAANNKEKRFFEVDEMTSVIMKFPNEQFATFTSSFGAADSSYYEIIGTKGILRLNDAYGYATSSVLEVSTNNRTTQTKFQKSDQFGAELSYFSDCILKNKQPEPSGVEGLADVRIIEALYKSAELGKSVQIERLALAKRPDILQAIRKPAISKPTTIHVESPRT